MDQRHEEILTAVGNVMNKALAKHRDGRPRHLDMEIPAPKMWLEVPPPHIENQIDVEPIAQALKDGLVMPQIDVKPIADAIRASLVMPELNVEPLAQAIREALVMPRLDVQPIANAMLSLNEPKPPPQVVIDMQPVASAIERVGMAILEMLGRERVISKNKDGSMTSRIK